MQLTTNDTPTKPTDPIVMYLVVRSSLGMSAGKAAAQVGHAVMLLMLKRDEMLADYDKLKWNDLVDNLAGTHQKLVDDIILFNKWANGDDYRKVVLTADEAQWNEIKEQCKDHVLVVDSGFTEIEPNSETVIGLLPMTKSSAPKCIKALRLLK